jgi:hypothetical protein
LVERRGQPTLWRALAIAGGIATIAGFLYATARRVPHPYDLEWMEGGMLCHALRLLAGRPLYGPPSVEFVPFLYTPLYPALLALLSPIIPLGYGLGRAVSLLGFGSALVLGYVFIRRTTGSRACALAAMALPLGAFVPTGTFIDLARPDSLYLGLVTAGVLVGWWRRRSHAGVTVAALLLVAAFFTKQTATPFMAALGLALAVASPRRLPTYALALAISGLPLLYLLNRSSGGWFWTYVFQLHQQHDFYPLRAFVGSPLRLVCLLGPAALLVPWALYRRRIPDLLFATLIALTGALASCVGFGTQWAYTNAFLPGVLFSAVAIGTAGGLLVGGVGHEAPPPRRPAAAFLLLCVSLACAPGGLLPPVGRRVPASFGITADEPTGYLLGPYLPRRADRDAGRALVARLAATKGEVLIPFHPYYGHLAGKETYLHRMGVLAVGRAGLGAPRGLGDAISTQRFSLVVMDDKIDGNWAMWPGLLQRYRISEQIAGPKVPSGAKTAPRYILIPQGAAATPAPGPAPANGPVPGGAPAGVIDRELQ